MFFLFFCLFFFVERMKNATQQALDEIQNKTCIKFEIVDESSDKHFMEIIEIESDLCAGISPVGRQENGNEIIIYSCIYNPERVHV